MCVKQTKPTTEFCEFFVFCVFGACLRLRDLGEFIVVSRSGLRSFVFVWMSMTLESRDLIGGNGSERWKSCHMSTCFTNQCMNRVMKSFGQVCHLLSSRCVCFC